MLTRHQSRRERERLWLSRCAGVRRRVCRAGGALLLAGFGIGAGAADTWSGGGTNNNWSTGSNWVSGAAPANDGTATATFGGSTRLTPNTDADWSLQGMGFNSGAGAFTIGGNRLTLGANGITNNSSSLQTINNALVLGAAQTWSATSGDLWIGGTVNNGGSLLTAAGSSNLTVAGVISGTGGLTKAGTGVLTLSAANTFSGTLTLSAGTLAIGADNAAGTGGLSLGASATIQASGGARSLNNTVAMSGNMTIGGANDLTFSGSWLLDGGDRTLTVDNTGVTTFAGQLGETSGGRKLIKAGSGTLVLTASNAIMDEVTVVAGILNLRHGNALDSTSYKTKVESGAALELEGGIAVGSENVEIKGSGISGGGALRNVSGDNSWAGEVRFADAATVSGGSGTLTLSGPVDSNGKAMTYGGSGDIAISGIVSGSGSLIKNGAGTLSLSGSNSYSGASTVNEGIVRLENATGFGTIAGGVTVADGAAVHVQGGIAVGIEALTLNGTGVGGTGSLLNLSGNNSWAGGVTLGSATTIGSDGGTLTLSGAFNNGGYGATFTGSDDITASGVMSGTGGVTKTGGGTLTLSGNSTYSGLTVVREGVLSLQHGAAAGSTAAGTVISNGAALQVQGNIAVGTEALMLGGSGIAGSGVLRNIDGANSWAGAVTLTGDSMLASDAGTLTLSGAIGGGGNLTKIGSGTLALSGANTFTGALAVTTGVLNLQNNAAAGTTAGGVTVSEGAALQLQGGITVGDESLSVSGSGVGGSGAVRNVSGTNSWAGGVSLQGATTVASDAGLLTFSGALNNAGYQLSFGGAGNLTVSGVLSGTGALVKSGAGVLTLSGMNTYMGDSTINGGTVVVNSASSLGDAGAGLTINAGTLRAATGFSSGRSITLGDASSTIQVDPAQTLALSGVLDGSGGLTKTGEGTLSLSGANTFSGAVGVNAGVLDVQSSGALGTTGSGVSVSSGAAVQLQGGVAVGAEALTLNGAGVASGGALRNVSGANSWGGTVTLGSASTIASDAGTLMLSGAVDNGGYLATVQGAGNTTMSGAMSGTGGLTKTGSGTLTLSGANTFSGAITVSAGALQAQHASALGSTGAGTTVSSGAALEFAGNIAVGAEALTVSGTGVGGGGAVRNVSGDNSFAGAIALGDVTTFSSDAGALTLSGGIDSNSKGMTFAGSGNITVSGSVTEAAGITKTGSGTLTLSGGTANTFSGDSYLNEGTIELNKTAGIDAIATRIYVGDGSGGAEADVIRWLGSDQIKDDKEVHVLSSGLVDLSGYDDKFKLKTMTGGKVTTGAGMLTLADHITTVATNVTAYLEGNVNLGANRDFTVGDGSVAVDFEISANLSGSYDLEMKGPGTLLLSGANTHSGGTVLSAGTLGIGHDQALGSGTFNLGVGNTVYAENGARTISNAVTMSTFTVNGSQDLTFAGAVALAVDTTITANNSGVTTISGAVSGAKKLYKDGAGTLVLSGNNSHNETYVNNGVLNIRHTGALGGSKKTVVYDGAALEVQGNIALGNETLELYGSGIGGAGALRNVSGDNSWAGPISLKSAGTIASDSGTLTISANINNGAYAATYAGAGNLTLNGVVSGTGGIAKNGAGTLTLAGANTFTGNISLNAGTLLLGASNVIADGNHLTIGNATFGTGGYSETLGTLTLAADSVIDFGNGATVLRFGDTSGVSWTSQTAVIIRNYSGTYWGGGTDQLYFGSTGSGLTAGQLAQIRFMDGNGLVYSATMLASGEVVPVPEPATVAGMILLVVGLGWHERKRIVGMLAKHRGKGAPNAEHP